MSQLPNGRGNNGGLERGAGFESGNQSAPRTPSSPGSKSLSPETLWDESGFPRKHKSFNVENDALNERWKSWQRQVTSHLLTTGSTWIFAGLSGTGKTQMATECGRAVCKAGSSAYYLPFSWMGLEIESTSQPAATQTVATYGRKLLSPRFLVIDDLSLAETSATHMKFLTNLIAMRHDNCLDTVILSTDDMEVLHEKLPPVVLHRCQVNDGFVKFAWSHF